MGQKCKGWGSEPCAHSDYTIQFYKGKFLQFLNLCLGLYNTSTYSDSSTERCYSVRQYILQQYLLDQQRFLVHRTLQSYFTPYFRPHEVDLKFPVSCPRFIVMPAFEIVIIILLVLTVLGSSVPFF